MKRNVLYACLLLLSPSYLPFCLLNDVNDGSSSLDVGGERGGRGFADKFRFGVALVGGSGVGKDRKSEDEQLIEDMMRQMDAERGNSGPSAAGGGGGGRGGGGGGNGGASGRRRKEMDAMEAELDRARSQAAQRGGNEGKANGKRGRSAGKSRRAPKVRPAETAGTCIGG